MNRHEPVTLSHGHNMNKNTRIQFKFDKSLAQLGQQ
jgi:hypothetical protein